MDRETWRAAVCGVVKWEELHAVGYDWIVGEAVKRGEFEFYLSSH